MDLVDPFISLNLRNSGTSENANRPRSPLRPPTPTLKRFFSPERPPSPRPVQPGGASRSLRQIRDKRLDKIEGATPKRKKFSRNLRKTTVRRILFDQSPSRTSTSLVQTTSTPPVVNQYLVEVDSSLFDTPPKNTNFTERKSNEKGDFHFNSPSSSGFVFSSSRSTSSQTGESQPKYMIEIDPTAVLSAPTSSSQISLDRQQSHCHCHGLYKSRLRAKPVTSPKKPIRKSVEMSDTSCQTSSISDDSAQRQQNLLLALECPVCYSHCIPPIWQCRWGHVVCNSCLPRCHQMCPVCRMSGPDAFSRSVALDNVANELAFPCRFVELGCSATSLSTSDKSSHERNCPFKR